METRQEDTRQEDDSQKWDRVVHETAVQLGTTAGVPCAVSQELHDTVARGNLGHIRERAWDTPENGTEPGRAPVRRKQRGKK
jgi:hypothetical protein